MPFSLKNSKRSLVSGVGYHNVIRTLENSVTKTKNRAVVRTGAAGAFAPVNFQQRVHCTRPDEELSNKWPMFSLKRSFSV